MIIVQTEDCQNRTEMATVLATSLIESHMVSATTNYLEISFSFWHLKEQVPYSPDNHIFILYFTTEHIPNSSFKSTGIIHEHLMSGIRHLTDFDIASCFLELKCWKYIHPVIRSVDEADWMRWHAMDKRWSCPSALMLMISEHIFLCNRQNN